MERGSQTNKEWEQYSSHNIKILERLPMSELYALGEVLKGIVIEGTEAKTNGEIPEEEVEFEELYMDVARKRLDIVTVAKFKKIEQMFKNLKFK
jgi:hypothetical protein